MSTRWKPTPFKRNTWGNIQVVGFTIGAVALLIWLGPQHWTLALFFGLLAATLASSFYDSSISTLLGLPIPAALGMICIQGGVIGWILALPLFAQSIYAAREAAKNGDI